MNNNKEYGVELQLKTKKFKNSLKSISDTVKQTTDKMKQNLSTGFNLDKRQAQSDIKKSKKMIQDYTNKLAPIQKEFGKISGVGTTSTGMTISSKELAEIDNYKNKIVGLNNAIKATQQDLNTLDNSPLAKLGQLAGSVRDRIISAWQYIKNFGKDGASSVSKVINELKETNSLSAMIGNGMTSLGGSIDKGFSKGLRSLKRFAFSLFGIHSIWRVVSRASSEYLSYDTELTNKITRNWVALGAMLEPLLTWITNLISKIVGYVNVFVKAFTGVDYVAKANKKITSTTKETTKAVKDLNKELTSLDEITNLTFDESNNNIDTGVGIPENPLERFEDIELNPSIVKWVQEVAEKAKELWNWLKQNVDVLKEVAIVAGVAFGAFQLGKLIKNVATLLGVSGGTAGIYGLITAFAIFDAIQFVRLIGKLAEVKDAVDALKKAEDGLTSGTIETWQRYLEILQDTNADEEQKSRVLGSLEASYEAYVNELKNGTNYSKEQREEMERLVKEVEKVSGKTFKTKIEADMDIIPTQRSNSFLDKVTRAFTGLVNSGLGWFNSTLENIMPKFASGTVAYRTTYGQFGEYSGASTNPEIVSPQSIMEETLYNALAKALPLVNNNNSGGDIILDINGREFARAIYSDLEYETNRVGKNTSIRRI